MQVSPPDLFPMDWENWVASVCCVGISVLAAFAGLGGGPLFVPLLMIVVQLSPYYAIPISKAMIFGVSLAQFLANVAKRRPVPSGIDKTNVKKNRIVAGLDYTSLPVIDFDAALLMEPMTLLGTVFGVFLNVVMPIWITMSAILFVLVIVLYKTSGNALRVWDIERSPDPVSSDPVSPLHIQKTRSQNKDDDSEYIDQQEEEEKVGLVVDLDFPTDNADLSSSSDSSQDLLPPPIPISQVLLRQWFPFTTLVFIWIFVFLVTLFKGGGSDEYSIIGIKECSPVYWILVVSLFPVIIAIDAGWAWKLLQTSKERVRTSGLSSDQLRDLGEIVWDKHSLWFFPFLSLLTGVVAGMMGLGGGMIKGPLLLSLGNNRNVQLSSATCSFMIMFTASSTALQFLILDRLNYQYALWYGGLGFLGAALGKIGISVIQTKKSFYIIVCVLLLLSVGFYFLWLYGFYEVRLEYAHHTIFNFNRIC